jgi:SagB-type dehydrogenase family enzyme
MSNRETAAAWEYHNRTKHSPESVRRSAHFLDWANQPQPFKTYTELEPIPLPREAGRSAAPDLQGLAHLLYYSAGITRRRPYPGGEILFRTYSCTGALYEIELYVVCGDLPGLPAGVYHFHPADFAVRRLRAGDFRGVLAAATAHDPSVRHAPALVISTGTYWRNAWKYQARTYRHFGWDNGTLHANLLATAAGMGWPARLLCGFVDSEVNALLDVDTGREVALALVALGHSDGAAPEPPPVEPLGLRIAPVSEREVDYPAMRRMHEASSLASAKEVAQWRQNQEGSGQPPPENLEEVILRRGSSRRFSRASIGGRQLGSALDCAAKPIPADFPPLTEMYVVAHAVDGLDAGAWYYNREERHQELLKSGDFRAEAAHLALDQDLAGDAAAAVFFLADLEGCLARFGNRGYRAAQLEAGIRGGRLYLASYAQRYGATGLTFYDDETVAFFAPHAAGKSAIFLVAMGHRAARA